MPSLKSALICLIAIPAAALAQSSASIDLLSFASSNAQVVGGVHITAAKSSALGQFLLSQIQSTDANLQNFITETGVDPRTDLSDVVLIMNSAPSAGSHNGLIAAHGSFSNSIVKLEATAQSNGGSVNHLSGVDVIHPGSSGNACVALYTDAATAVIGDCASVQAALASAGPDAPTGSALFTKAVQYRSTQDLWFSSIAPLGQLAGAVPGNFNSVLNSSLLQSIQQTSGGVKLTGTSTAQGPAVSVTGEALMDTPQNATALMNVVNFFKSFIQMQNTTDPAASALITALGGLQTSVNGSTLTGSVVIPESTLEQLFQTIHQNATVAQAEVGAVAR